MNWFSPWGTRRGRRRRIRVQMVYDYTMGDFKLAKGGIMTANFLWSF